MEPLPISVVVCVRNRAEEIEGCLESILANHPAEVLVMDGDSEDETRVRAARYPVQVINCGRRGLAHDRALGMQMAQQPFVAYVDSDVRIAPKTLETLLAELQERGWAGIHAQIDGAPPRNYWEWAQDQHFQLTFNHPGPRSSIGLVCALFRTDVLREVGFAEGLSAAEDGDLSLHLTARGYTLGVAAQARCIHHHRADFRSFFQQRIWYGEGTMRLALLRKSLWIAMGPLLMPFAASGLALLKGQPRLIPYFWANALGYWVGMSRELSRALSRRLSPRPT
jgi:glycosyltransferase involved in cell wall biosynthesis